MGIGAILLNETFDDPGDIVTIYFNISIACNIYLGTSSGPRDIDGRPTASDRRYVDSISATSGPHDVDGRPTA